MADNKKIAKSAASSKRDELLRERQMALTVQGKTIEEVLQMKSEDIKVPVNNIEDKKTHFYKILSYISACSVCACFISSMVF